MGFLRGFWLRGLSLSLAFALLATLKPWPMTYEQSWDRLEANSISLIEDIRRFKISTEEAKRRLETALTELETAKKKFAEASRLLSLSEKDLAEANERLSRISSLLKQSEAEVDRLESIAISWERKAKNRGWVAGVTTTMFVLTLAAFFVNEAMEDGGFLGD